MLVKFKLYIYTKLINYILKAIWDDEENRKMIFENIAQDLGFNPYISEFWYMQHTETLMEYKV